MNSYLMAFSQKNQVKPVQVQQVLKKEVKKPPILVQQPIQSKQEEPVQQIQEERQVVQNKPIKKFLTNRVNGKFISNNPNQVKKQKKDQPWLSTFKIIQIDKPNLIESNNTNKRFSISFQYIDESTGKVHKKTVKFGQKNQEEFIDHHNYQLREKTLNNLRKYHNPLKGNFWRNQLLNTTDNLQENYMNLLKTLF